MIFIERIIYTVLTSGIQRMRDNPELYEKFLLEGGLDADEASRAREVFEDQPPTVVHNYARSDGTFPCYAIVLGQESTDTDFLGEDAMSSYIEPDEDGYIDEDDREEYLDDEGNRQDMHVRRWGHNFEVYVYATHPDLTLYYYYLAKMLLVSSRSSFQAQDLDEITYTGADLAPDPRYLPAGLFCRRLGMRMTSDLSYVELLRSGIGAGTTIGGAHVAEDSDDATGVTPAITVNVTETTE